MIQYYGIYNFFLNFFLNLNYIYYTFIINRSEIKYSKTINLS